MSQPATPAPTYYADAYAQLNDRVQLVMEILEAELQPATKLEVVELLLRDGLAAAALELPNDETS